MSRSLPAFVLGSSLFALDQATKSWAAERLPGRPIEVIRGFFDLVWVTNTGAAWGILRDKSFGLALLALAALVFLFFARHQFTRAGTVSRIALGLLLGGIAGNLLDRVTYGHVIDFLSFHVGRYHWPAFNVADSAICTGVGLYLIESFRTNRDSVSGKPVA